MKKALISLLLLLVMTGLISFGSIYSLAEGPPAPDPNVSGGGGGYGEGDKDNVWHGGDDGVRISIMHGLHTVYTFDMANKDWSRTIQKNGIIYNKLWYRTGGQFQLDSMGYINVISPPGYPMPRIIPKKGTSTIPAIRSYFSDTSVIRYIAEKAGMEYETLTNGDYKLMIEPIAYFRFKGDWWAMTATEAGVYNAYVDSRLRSKMPSLTHQNLPLALFLERDDLTMQKWTGTTTGRVNDWDIINSLGVGIITFAPIEEIPPPETEYLYRTNTDVITSVLIKNKGSEKNPDFPGKVTFHINGRSYTRSYICPSNQSQLVWVKWRTPSTPQEIEINVTEKTGNTTETVAIVHAKIVDISGEEPPNPVYDGPGIGAGQYIKDFKAPEPLDWGSQTETQWSQWTAEFVPLPLRANGIR